MNIRSANTKRSFRRVIPLVVFLAVLLIITPFIVPAVGGVFRSVLRPISAVGRSIGNTAQSIGSFFLSKAHLEKENNDLRAEIAELNTRLLDESILLQDNLALQEVLNRKVSRALTLARVLIKPNRSLYDTIIVDVGKNAHIQSGARVFAYGNVPIGVVETVDSKTSLVRLYSSPGEVLTGRIEELHIDITLTGRGGGNFETELPRDVAVKEGSAVLLPAATPLIVAKFGKDVSDPRDPSQKFILTSPVNMSELDMVQIEQSE